MHRPVGLVELLIVYARVQFYTPRASDYRLISKTVISHVNFLEIPDQNTKKMKHNECHNLMFLEFLSNVEENKMCKLVSRTQV